MSLTGKKPGESYIDLLQMDNTNTGVDGTLRAVKDGEGTATPLLLSDSAVQVSSTPTNPNDVANKTYVDSVGRVLLGTYDLAGISTLDITGVGLENYSNIEFDIINVRPGADNNDWIMLQYFVDSTIRNSVGNYGFSLHGLRNNVATIGASADGTDAASNSIYLTYISGWDSGDATQNTNGTFRIINPDATGDGSYSSITGQLSWWNINNRCFTIYVAGQCRVAGSVTGLRFQSNKSTNFTAGKIKIWGMN